MAVKSSGRYGDQVALTSKLHEFQQPRCVVFEFRLNESKPEASGRLSVYLLSRQHVPTKLHLESWSLNEGWKRGRVYIPSGTYHLMFLATLGLPFVSDIYLDNIELEPGSKCGSPGSVIESGD